MEPKSPIKLASTLLAAAPHDSLNRADCVELRARLNTYFERCAIAMGGCVHPASQRTYLGGREMDATRVQARYVCGKCGKENETILPAGSEAAVEALWAAQIQVARALEEEECSRS